MNRSTKRCIFFLCVCYHNRQRERLMTSGGVAFDLYHDDFFDWVAVSFQFGDRSSFSAGACSFSSLFSFLSSFTFYCLCTSCRGWKALCTLMCFLDLWYISWSFSLVHFKNGPKYLMKWTAHVFISLKSFLLCVLV